MTDGSVLPMRACLSLGELGRTSRRFETVLLSFLPSRVSREETGLLEKGTVAVVREEKRAGNAVTDRAGLAGDAAAVHVRHDVELANRVRNAEGLVDDELQGLETEVIVNVAVVDGDLAGTGIQSDAGNGALSSAGAVEIRFCTRVHRSIPDLSSISTSYGVGFCACCLCSSPA